MTPKQRFMFKHIKELTLYYENEAKGLGYKDKEAISNYIKQTLRTHTFIGTKRELRKEFRRKADYVIICRGLSLYAVEAFNGKEYNILEG